MKGNGVYFLLLRVDACSSPMGIRCRWPGASDVVSSVAVAAAAWRRLLTGGDVAAVALMGPTPESEPPLS